MCSSGTLLPSANAYKAWVGHLSSMWEQVSKITHVACKGQSCVGPLAPKWTNCLRAWNKSSPIKRCFWGQCPSKILSALGGSFWDLLQSHGFVTLKGTPLPLVVHFCLQQRLIKHEWGASFFDVGASFKNCSHRLQRTKLCGSFTPKADKLLAGLEQILPYNNNYNNN